MKNNIDIPEIGAHMKHMVKKAIGIIQEESHALVAESKVPYDLAKGKEDFVTNGDKRAQEMYVREIRRLFPAFGIIAEEKEFAILSSHPDHDIYFTVDPLDGTKAYKRKQSHGVGTMIALVCDGKVVAAYIGDANTGDIYGYAQASLDEAPEHTVVGRERFGRITRLVPDKEPLIKRYALLRDTPGKQHGLIRLMIRYPEKGGLFKDHEVEGGSIGMSFGRLWNGEVGALMLLPTVDTPWDVTPVIGISLKLGFRFFKLIEGKSGLSSAYRATFIEYDPEVLIEVKERRFTSLIVHQDQIGQMKEWLREHTY